MDVQRVREKCAGEMSKRHINEFMRTSFSNSGRVAGAGISYDRYDEESNPDLKDKYYDPYTGVAMPGRSKEERASLDGPVIIYFIPKDSE